MRNASLTPTEKLYYTALEESEKGVSLEELLDIKRAEPTVRSSNLVASHIKEIRRKLPKGMRIVSLRGFGYKLEKV